MTDNAPAPTPRGRPAVAALSLVILLLAAGALLWPLTSGGFVVDDFPMLRAVSFGPGAEQPVNRGPDPVAAWRFFLEPVQVGHQVYRPIIGLTCAAQLALSGPDPFAFQLANLGLHLLCGALVFWLAGRIAPGLGAGPRLVGTAFFLVSPVQLEAVSWTAARSETLSLAAGALALGLALGPRRPLVLPAILALLALWAKESGVVFALLLVGHGLARTGRSWGGRLRDLAPLGIAVAVYLAGRVVAFGGLGARYGARAESEFTDPDRWRSLIDSLAVALLPWSDEFHGGPLESARLPFVFATITGLVIAAVLLPAGLRARGGRRAFLMLLALFVVPFVLSALVNLVGPRLVNTRAFYTPMAALAIGIAIAAGAGGRRLTAALAVLLVGAAALASRPTQALYLEMHAGIGATIDSVREAVRDLEPAYRDVVILGYREDDYFGGSYTSSGSLEHALLRPFVPLDRRVIFVRTDEVAPEFPHLTPFLALDRLEKPAAILRLVPPPERPRRYGLVHRAAWPKPPQIVVTPVSPASGTKQVVDLAHPESLVTTFVAETTAPADARYRLRILCMAAVLVNDLLPPEMVVREGSRIRVDVPMTSDFRELTRWYRHFAWTLVAEDAEGRELGPTPLSFLEIEVVH
ncbi:MAG: hypothetical protein R3F20_17030 [Planctomycetota bacterium]